MYADNNGLKVGDVIYDAESPLLPPAKWTITGLVALSDYSAMFSDNNDSMFDSLKFGVAVVTPEEFAACSDKSPVYNYSFKYNDPPATEEEENDRAEDLMTDICAEVKLENFIPRCANQAIKFTGEDMGSDRAMMHRSNKSNLFIFKLELLLFGLFLALRGKTETIYVIGIFDEYHRTFQLSITEIFLPTIARNDKRIF